MLKRRHKPQRKSFAPIRVFASRYRKVTIIYRNGRPWERRVTSHGGQYQSRQLLVAVSIKALETALGLRA